MQLGKCKRQHKKPSNPTFARMFGVCCTVCLHFFSASVSRQRFEVYFCVTHRPMDSEMSISCLAELLDATTALARQASAKRRGSRHHSVIDALLGLNEDGTSSYVRISSLFFQKDTWAQILPLTFPWNWNLPEASLKRKLVFRLF